MANKLYRYAFRNSWEVGTISQEKVCCWNSILASISVLWSHSSFSLLYSSLHLNHLPVEVEMIPWTRGSSWWCGGRLTCRLCGQFIHAPSMLSCSWVWSVYICSWGCKRHEHGTFIYALTEVFTTPSLGRWWTLGHWLGSRWFARRHASWPRKFHSLVILQSSYITKNQLTQFNGF